MGSRHPRARSLPRSLFHSLASFRDLEARIASLPEELQRGDAFEVFVEAYLWLTTVWQVDDLWLVGQVPLEVRRGLNLPSDAKGIDGVFRTRSGTLVPYQVKHRLRRPQVNVAEVSTFLALTERAADRVLISNSNRYAGDVENRDHLRVVRGSDFDDLTEKELAAIADWLADRPATRERRSPLPHQARALADITTALSTHDRATVVMACGTGKTLVGLWVAEQQSPSTVLVLLPSLALLSQALGDWSRDTAWGERFEYLCVCSDPSVAPDEDAVQVRSADVPFHVDTDAAEVRRFLNRPAASTLRVVFSTYHSSAVVAEGTKGLAPFDLGIFDEAHKTTGAKDTTFALALDDARLPVRKRLFLTATPRHIDIRHRDREGDFRVVSMDDEAVYGPRAHTLTFAEAVAQGLICDYRVVVSVVDPAEVTAFALRHGITLVAGDQQATRWVASQIAISKAIAETGAQKIITFHSRVAQAQAFASPTVRGIGQHLDEEFMVAHVNGGMRVADRTDILSRLSDNGGRLVTNARCLTEGVDLPAVDMVAFCNPRKSRIDIVQAVGRAMRKPQAGAKTLGYVVVPILLAPHQADDLEEGARNTDWEDIVDVLAALREHDTRLEDLIRDAQIAKGRGEVFNPRVFAERVQVAGPFVSLDVLDRHVNAVVLERLGGSWDEMFGRLVAYKAAHGDCDVPEGYSADPRLARWCQRERHWKKTRKLSPERFSRLDALGFVWEPQIDSWNEMFLRLVAYQTTNGNCDVPANYPADPQLASWCNTQRTTRKKGKLSPERIARLDAQGFAWDPLSSSWNEMFGRLAAYKATYGNSDVPFSYHADPSLGLWCGNQRGRRRNGKLSPDRVARLDALGFEWDPYDAAWEEMFGRLVAYRTTNGNCDVPAHYPADPQLASWCNTQRTRRKKGKLSPERIARLYALGFVWDPISNSWDEMFGRLVAYTTRHGACNVPEGFPADLALARWCHRQRIERRQNTLFPERVSKLDALGFEWNPLSERWEEMFGRLAEYKGTHGNCGVPARYPADPSLGKWCSHQRTNRKEGIVSGERVTRLDALGFEWNSLSDSWEEMFGRLIAYKAAHGNCNVPAKYSADPSLGKWCSYQRARRKIGKVSPARVASLDALGFEWNPKGGAPRGRRIPPRRPEL